MLRMLLLLGCAATALVPGAQAQTTKLDSGAVAGLGSTINGRALIRVRGDWGTADLARPHLVGRQLDYAEASTPARSVIALPRPFPLDTIRRIQVPGNAAGTGAMVGASVGLLGGLALGIGLTESLCNGGSGCSNAGGGAATITLAATLGGAVLGAVIGSTMRKWKTIYEAGSMREAGSQP
jgi:hypothetical protein